MDSLYLVMRSVPGLGTPTCALLLAIILCTVSYLLKTRKSMSQLFVDIVPDAISRRVSAWVYLFNGVDMIQERFDKSLGRPFEMLAPDGRYVFVSSAEHLNELDTAPDTVLSLLAAAKQMFQPRYTMHGFNWFDLRGTEGIGLVRAIRTLLTNNLPHILPDLGVINRAHLAKLLSESPERDGSIRGPVYPIVVKMVSISNAFSLFGKELAQNEEFVASALGYIEQTLLCAEAVRLAPSFAVPLVARIVGRRVKSHQTIFKALLPIAQQRVEEKNLGKLGQAVPKHDDCIQWILDTSPRQKPFTAERVVYELLAIWFGSVHALSTTITFAIEDLCLHPEYVSPLREELAGGYGDFEKTGQGLPFLDSFIKESARMTPVEAMSTRRCATQPFTLSDGTSLEVGDWACTPVKAIMHNPEYFPEPFEFNGFRFVERSLLEAMSSRNSAPVPPVGQRPSGLTDADNTFHVWGSGRMVCPGRFYAAATIKVVIGQILMNYDCSLVEPKAPRWFTWRSSMLPRSSTLVRFIPL